MNWDRIEGNWMQIKGRVQQRWGAIVDDTRSVASGKRHHYAGTVQAKYGATKDEASKQLSVWRKQQKDLSARNIVSSTHHTII